MMHQEGGIHDRRRGRASMRVAGACLVMAYAAGSCAVDDYRDDELAAMHVARSSDELQAIQQLFGLIAAAVAMAAATAKTMATIDQCRDSTAAGPELQPLPQPAGRSSVDVIPAPAPEPSQPHERRRNTCETAFPAMAECWTLPADYTFRSPQAALRDMKVSTRNHSLKLHNQSRTETGPCIDTGSHYNVRAGANRAGSIVCCPCCSDNLSGPVKGERCRIVW